MSVITPVFIIRSFGLLCGPFFSCTIYKTSSFPTSVQPVSCFLRLSSWRAYTHCTSFLINFLGSCFYGYYFISTDYFWKSLGKTFLKRFVPNSWSRWSDLNRRPTPSWIPLFLRQQAIIRCIIRLLGQSVNKFPPWSSLAIIRGLDCILSVSAPLVSRSGDRAATVWTRWAFNRYSGFTRKFFSLLVGNMIYHGVALPTELQRHTAKNYGLPI